MPIYEYRCRSCGRSFDHLHRRLAEPAPACPFCGRRRVEKQFSPFAPTKGQGGELGEPVCKGGGSCSGRCPAAEFCRGGTD